MNIGIIIYSQTGNTNSVALNLKEALEEKGHKVALERITADEPKGPKDPSIRLTYTPDPGPFEAVIFGAPVQAFSLAQAMKTYLAQVGDLTGKKTACFVTKQLPGNWTGGNSAIRKMMKFCEAKGAAVTESGIVHWAEGKREESIMKLIPRLIDAF
jgi:flavodoxin